MSSNRKQQQQSSPATITKVPRGGGGDGKATVQLHQMPNHHNHLLHNPFIQSTLLHTFADVIGFLISVTTGSHYHLDLIGTGSFAVVGAFFLFTKTTNNLPAHSTASLIAQTIWGTKLATFLAYRAFQVHTDKRLEGTLSTVSGMFGFWFITWLWQVVTSLPTVMGMMATTTSSTQAKRASSWLVKAGMVIFTLGLLIETGADAQKWQFKHTHPSGEPCMVGLWKFSQHPNFFGNLLLWTGIFLTNASALSGKNLVIAALSPAFLLMLFYGQATGNITDAVNMSMKKYGHIPEFQKYVESTPLVIPNIIHTAKKLFGK